MLGGFGGHMEQGTAGDGAQDVDVPDGLEALDSLGAGFLAALRRALGVAAADGAAPSPPEDERDAPPDLQSSH